jgi:hypothetical protein
MMVEPESLASELPNTIMQLAYKERIEPIRFSFDKKKKKG